MKSLRFVLLTALVSIALLMHGAAPSCAKVKSLSTDGEATVYLNADFTRSFDLDYRVAFAPAPHNRSWSLVAILVLSAKGHGGSASVGLTRGFPNATTLAAFTTSAKPGKKQTFKSSPVFCASRCRIELRGSAETISAIVNGTTIATWSRQSLGLREPAVQLNAEVAGVADSISASVVPVRTVASGRAIRPTCAFTTQGVEPKPRADGISFTGSRRPNARVTYISLVTGATGDSCPKR